MQSKAILFRSHKVYSKQAVICHMQMWQVSESDKKQELQKTKQFCNINSHYKICVAVTHNEHTHASTHKLWLQMPTTISATIKRRQCEYVVARKCKPMQTYMYEYVCSNAKVNLQTLLENGNAQWIHCSHKTTDSSCVSLLE